MKRILSMLATAARGTDVPAAEKEGPQSGTDLKAEMLKLMNNARAGSISPSSPPRQQQPVKSNGFNKGQKVAVGVSAAAVVIILVIALSRGKDSDRFKAPPCPAGQLCL